MAKQKKYTKTLKSKLLKINKIPEKRKRKYTIDWLHDVDATSVVELPI